MCKPSKPASWKSPTCLLSTKRIKPVSRKWSRRSEIGCDGAGAGAGDGRRCANHQSRHHGNRRRVCYQQSGSSRCRANGAGDQRSDVTVLVLVPGMGDDVQTIKAGIMEIADVFVINKADQAGVAQMEQEIRDRM